MDLRRIVHSHIEWLLLWWIGHLLLWRILSNWSCGFSFFLPHGVRPIVPTVSPAPPSEPLILPYFFRCLSILFVLFMFLGSRIQSHCIDFAYWWPRWAYDESYQTWFCLSPSIFEFFYLYVFTKIATNLYAPTKFGWLVCPRVFFTRVSFWTE